MRIQQFTIGSFATNSYVIYESGRCSIVDAPRPMGSVISFLKDRGLVPDEILLTHGHFDHVFGLGEARAAFPGVRIFLSEEDRFFFRDDFRATRDILRMMPLCPDESAYDGFPLDFLGWDDYDGEFSIIRTPGHTPGSVSLYSGKEGILFSGDTLFRDGIGRTDLGGSYSELSASLRKLSELPGDTLVLPGHGVSTEIKRELH